MTVYETIVAALQAQAVDYIEIEHQPIYTVEEAAQVDGLSLEEGAKSLLLKTKNSYVLAVLAGSKRLDSKKFKKLLQVRDIRFATPAEVNQQMGCMIGSCHPFGSLADLETYLDRSLLKQTNISFNPGVHHRSIRLKLEAYLAIENPNLVELS
jgi:prolyl-tRNA editing enzyme YbaK/EbsC (Cys-tRNA(Pro) deacylase)